MSLHGSHRFDGWPSKVHGPLHEGIASASHDHRARVVGLLDEQTLDKFAVPQAEQAEIKAMINSTRADIVV
jgi:hypothetical protein